MGTKTEFLGSTDTMEVKFLVNCKVLHKCDCEWEGLSLMGPVCVIKAAVYSCTGCALLNF